MGSGGRRDTRPLPPVRCEDSLHDVLLPTILTPTLSSPPTPRTSASHGSGIPRTTSWREFMPRTASWRDMIVAQAGRARADASASVRARVFRTVSLPGSLADLSAEHLKGVVPPRAHLYAMHELFLDNFLARHERLEGKRLWLFNPLSPARVACTEKDAACRPAPSSSTSWLGTVTAQRGRLSTPAPRPALSWRTSGA